VLFEGSIDMGCTLTNQGNTSLGWATHGVVGQPRHAGAAKNAITNTIFSTVALGARYASLSMVVIGTTLGMMAANIPAVLSGECLTRFVPVAKCVSWPRRYFRYLACWFY